MEYIIAVIGVIVALFLIGYFMKRKYFKEIDRYETWKIDLMNRPVLEEMTKMKKLNMTGQTEELFEKWRDEWDDIVAVQLPNIEEYLFDGEEHTEKYRFRNAKDTFEKIEQKLKIIEENIDKILGEIKELVGSEEKNRNEIELLKEKYRDCRKNLLAHRHSFGKTEKALEEQLNEVLENFKVFDEKTESGDYLEAREIVLSIQDSLDSLATKMEFIPQFIHDCQIGLPSQINELREGYREMNGSGYPLDHIGIEQEAAALEQQLAELSSKIGVTDVAEFEQDLEAVRTHVDQLFDHLEGEVKAKHYVHSGQEALKDQLESAINENEKIQTEIDTVKQIYHVSDQELEAHFLVENALYQQAKRFEVIVAKFNQGETAYSFLSEELMELKQDLEECQREQDLLQEKLAALRKDEKEARKKLRELSREITEMIKLITKSNLPGMPQSYHYLLDDAKESIQNVSEKLEQKPLNMQKVQEHLEIAELTVEKLIDTTKQTIDDVQLAERVIQYGNRYRSRYSSVADGLEEAEELFRNFEYGQAIEKAIAVIEEVEPGAMEKIKDLFVETHV